MPGISVSPAADISPLGRSTQRVLWISEIQDHIFAFNDVADATRCARVCKTWKEKALDHVWYTLPGLEPLLRLFAPSSLVFNRTFSENDLRSIISPSDWERAMSLLQRVKILQMDLDQNPQVFPSELFNDLLVSRPEKRILPNLKALRLTVGSKSERLRYMHMVPFIHDRLSLLEINGDMSSSELTKPMEVFLEEIANRAKSLRQVLFLSTIIGIAGSLDAILSRFFTTQTSLEVVELSKGMLTAPVFKSLSYLPKLRQIDLKKNRNVLNVSYLNACRSISCQRGGELFPSLLHLDVMTSAASISSLISSHSSFTRLKHLKVAIIHQDAEDMQKCIETISTTCGHLEVLRLTCFSDDGHRETKHLTTDTIAPLASFRFLKSFGLAHMQPIVITDNDLVELLGRCAELIELSLNPHPWHEPASPSALPSLGVLHRIARCQPKLEKLSLYLTAAKEHDPDLPYNTSAFSTPFENLKTLNLGKSAIDDVDWATGYLSQIFPPTLQLKCTSGDSSFLDKWAEVRKRLPTHARVISEQRKWANTQIRLLEAKVKSRERELSNCEGVLEDDSCA